MVIRILFLAALVLIPIQSLAQSVTADQDRYDITVSLDIPNKTVTGEAIIDVQFGEPVRFSVGTLQIKEVKLNRQKVDITREEGTLLVHPGEKGSLSIHFEGIFPAKGAGNNDENVIGHRGIFLSRDWYPRPERLLPSRLKATFPAGYEALSEGDTVVKREGEGVTEFTFDFPYPAEGISLAASDRYNI
jgi:hypothetical protein